MIKEEIKSFIELKQADMPFDVKDRRGFIMNSTSQMRTITTLFAFPLLLFAFSSSAASLSPEEFKEPSLKYGPHTWWHWVNGNVSKAGITADLEAMKRIGIAGAQMFDVAGSSIPAGPVPFSADAGSAWMDAVLHAHNEAKRLGLELCLANCSGYSSSGGPWIDAEKSMKRLVFTEALVTNGTKAVLAVKKEDVKNDFYRDIAVVAFPTPKIEEITLGVAPKIDAGYTMGESHRSFTYDFGRERSFSDISYVHTQMPAHHDLAVLTSPDGETWTEVLRLKDRRGGYNDESWRGRRDHHLDREITARHVRILFDFPKNRNGTYYTKTSDVKLGALGRMDQLGLKIAELGQAPDENNPPLREIAVDPKKVVDVSAALKGDAVTLPAKGNWTVLRVGYTSTGRVCAPATWTGRGLEVDKLDKAAVDFHFDAYIGKIAKMCRIDPKSDPKNRPGFNMTLIDSWEVGSQNWTKGFEKVFRARKGYDLKAFYPALAGYLVGSYAKSQRVLADFRGVIEELFGECYADEMARKCRAAGILFAVEPYSGQPCSTERYGRNVDVPMSEFWWKRFGCEDSEYSHTIASIAHVRGRDIVQAESFTSWIQDSSWKQSPVDYKNGADLSYADGVTRTVYHRFAHQPWLNIAPGMTMGYWGTQFERTLTWWDFATDWIKYQTRVQYLMQTGRFAADILYFKGAAIPSDAVVPKGLPRDYAYDTIGPDSLADVAFEKGRFRVPGGVTYAVLVCPDTFVMTDAVKAKLRALHADGAPIVKLSDLAAWLKGNLPTPTVSAKPGGRFFNWIHRTYDGGREAFFLVSRSWKDATQAVALRDCGVFEPEVWDAETGETYAVPFTRKDGATHLTLSFRPRGSLFVVFRAPKTGLAPRAELATIAEERLDTDWTVEFPAGWGAPASVRLAALTNLSQHAEAGVRYFSGTMVYKKTITLAKTGSRTLLSLGRVGEIARVKANGIAAPVLCWKEPYEADITEGVRAAKDGKVALEIEVANTWVNRLIGDQIAFGAAKGARYSAESVVSVIPDWVKNDEKPQAHGRFTFATQNYWNKNSAKDKNLPASGLIGPVVLKILSTNDTPVVGSAGQTGMACASWISPVGLRRREQK